MLKQFWLLKISWLVKAQWCTCQVAEPVFYMIFWSDFVFISWFLTDTVIITIFCWSLAVPRTAQVDWHKSSLRACTVTFQLAAMRFGEENSVYGITVLHTVVACFQLLSLHYENRKVVKGTALCKMIKKDKRIFILLHNPFFFPQLQTQLGGCSSLLFNLFSLGLLSPVDANRRQLLVIERV